MSEVISAFCFKMLILIAFWSSSNIESNFQNCANIRPVIFFIKKSVRPVIFFIKKSICPVIFFIEKSTRPVIFFIGKSIRPVILQINFKNYQISEASHIHH